MLSVDETALIVIDVQAKLLPAIDGKEELVEGVCRIIEGAKVLGLPIVWTEQNPGGLGATVPEVAELLSARPITKVSFSCCGESAFVEALGALGRKQVLLVGIESHVCVYQTASDLVEAGYEVHVVSDAVSSRTPTNRRIGLDKMARAGAHVTSVETALFELLRAAEGPAFKQILRIVK